MDKRALRRGLHRVLALAVLLGIAVAPRNDFPGLRIGPAAAQPATRSPVGGEAEPAPGDGANAEHAKGEVAGAKWDLAARLVNFAIMAGALVYLLRLPLRQYLNDRRESVRRELKDAERARIEAAERVQQIERRLQALPREIEALGEQAAREADEEQRRILAKAQQEAERLLAQARHEIQNELKIARRELAREAADLAVGLAEERIKRTITPTDQARLVDRYLDQLGRKPS